MKPGQKTGQRVGKRVAKNKPGREELAGIFQNPTDFPESGDSKTLWNLGLFVSKHSISPYQLIPTKSIPKQSREIKTRPFSGDLAKFSDLAYFYIKLYVLGVKMKLRTHTIKALYQKQGQIIHMNGLFKRKFV